jgi:hypothetical protein
MFATVRSEKTAGGVSSGKEQEILMWANSKDF